MLSVLSPTVFSAMPLNLVMQSPVLARDFIDAFGLDLISWIDMIVMQLFGML